MYSLLQNAKGLVTVTASCGNYGAECEDDMITKNTRVFALLTALLALFLVACEEEAKPMKWPGVEGPTLGQTNNPATGTQFGSEDNGLPKIKPMKRSEVIPTSPANRLEHGARKYSRKAQYGLAWVLLTAGILFPGPMLIFMIPGFLTGRLEKILEGAAIVAVGLFMLSLTGDARVASLIPWVWGCLLAPGALLFLWGCITESETGKTLIVVGPTVIFGLYCVGQVYRMVVLGVVGSALFTFLILGLFALILYGAASRLADGGAAA